MKKILIGVFAVLFLAACGEKVEVPPAHVGKILTKNGWQPENIPPSKFRLEKCWAYCDRLVLAELSDTGLKEEFTLFMPKDQLTMSFDVRATIRIKNDETSINQIFDRVVPEGAVGEGILGDGTSVITLGQIYGVYGRQVLRDVIRTAAAEFSIGQVIDSRAAVNAAITEAVKNGLQHTPLEIVRIGLAKVEYPKIITDAKEIAKQREVEIEQVEAENQIVMVKLERELEQARQERNIRNERAQAALEENNIISKSVTKEYLMWKQLEVLEKMAENKNAVFIPFDALGTVGLQQRVFQDKK